MPLVKGSWAFRRKAGSWWHDRTCRSAYQHGHDGGPTQTGHTEKGVYSRRGSRQHCWAVSLRVWDCRVGLPGREAARPPERPQRSSGMQARRARTDWDLADVCRAGGWQWLGMLSGYSCLAARMATEGSRDSRGSRGSRH